MLRPIFDAKALFAHDALLRIAAHFSKEAGTVLLYSGSDYDSAQCSFLALFPCEALKIEDGVFTHIKAGSGTITRRIEANPWELLKGYFEFDSAKGLLPEWFGYLSYEMGASSDWERTLPSLPPEYADCYFQRPALLIVYEKKSQKLSVAADFTATSNLPESQRTWIEKLSQKEGLIEFLQVAEQSRKRETTEGNCQILKPLDSFEIYAQKVFKAKELIAAGDIYQVNLSHSTRYKWERDPFDVFLHLNRLNPAPFSAYLSIAANHQLVSSSPERLLQLKEGRLETRPIKGTVKRGRTAKEDAQNKEALLHSEKDKAELLMITDLMRNDLGRVSLPGSVKTEQLRTCEAYTNVYHMLSLISSCPDLQHHPLDLLRACFPGGSITGCPKLRSMEIIADIEKHSRGIYTGSIGYFCANGDFDFNIAIRTLNFLEGIITAQVGGAIVYDSDPAQEYAETLSKGESLFQSLNVY